MSSRRNLIAMTPDEIKTYLRTQRRLILVSNGADGYPHPMPMNFLFDDQDRFVVTTFNKSQKVKNFQRDPRATLLVESGFTYNELRSVMAYAEAEMVTDEDIIFATMTALAAKETRLSATDLQVVREQALGTLAKRVVLRFKPERYISWDHSKLGGRY